MIDICFHSVILALPKGILRPSPHNWQSARDSRRSLMLPVH